MTKKLTDEQKAINLVKKLFRVTSKSNCTSCKDCPFKRATPRKNQFQLEVLTGMGCPKNQMRVVLQMITGIDRRLYE